MKPSSFGPRKKNSRRADKEKRCEPFLKWLRGRPCYISTVDPRHVCRGIVEGKVRACHFDPWGDKGMGTKVSDNACLPMCDGAHEEQGERLGWPKFQAKYGFDGRHVVTAFWLQWRDNTAMGAAWKAAQETDDDGQPPARGANQRRLR